MFSKSSDYENMKLWTAVTVRQAITGYNWDGNEISDTIDNTTINSDDSFNIVGSNNCNTVITVITMSNTKTMK